MELGSRLGQDMAQAKPSIVSPDLIFRIVEDFALSPNGVHGIGHWARVFENGHRVAELTGAKLDVVELFAVLHDAQRRSENHDADHGRRGAEYARSLRCHLFDLADRDFDLFADACTRHTDGLTHSDLTIQACWDADRLDLQRVGLEPRPALLSAPTARDADLLRWASQRGRDRVLPIAVLLEWGLLKSEGKR